MNERLPFAPTSGGPRIDTVTLSWINTARNFDSSTKAPTDVTLRRGPPVVFSSCISTGVATGDWRGNICGRKTIASKIMNTTPARREYRSNFVACGGGLRFRLNGTSGFEGRAIFMDSLHVNRRPAGDGVVRLLRGVPSLRIVRTEDVDLRTEFRSQEADVLAEHRELVDGTSPNRFIRFRVAQLLAEFLGVGRHLFRPVPHPRLREGPFHEHVHRDGSPLREGVCEFVEAGLPGRGGVQRDPLWRDPCDLQDLSNVSEGRLQQGFRAFRPSVDLPPDRLGIRRLDDEPIAPDPVPDLFASMGCERREELRLDLDEPTSNLRPRPALGSPDVPRPSGLQVEVAVAERGLVGHRFHRFACRLNRAAQDAQEPRINPAPFLPRGMARHREPDPLGQPSRSHGREVQVDVRVVEPI